MVLVKQSYKNKGKTQKPKEKKLGQEFGEVIENNPKNYAQTGKWRSVKPVVDESKCAGCGLCVELCPEAAIELKNKGGKKKAVIDYDFCKGCGICAEQCPIKAIKMKKEK